MPLNTLDNNISSLTGTPGTSPPVTVQTRMHTECDNQGIWMAHKTSLVCMHEMYYPSNNVKVTEFTSEENM